MAKFQVKQAKREQIFPKIALMAPSGGGKSYSSLRLATGMCEYIEKYEGRKGRILFANTEAKRGYYYANEFKYDIVDIEPPHNPEKYVDLIDFAVESKYDILIIDSASHEWEGKGGCLDLQQQAGGRYQDWAKVTPRHDKFINAIAYSPITIIATMRSKDAYEMEKDSNGRASVTKMGIGAKQRDGFEYEFSCTFSIDQKTSMAVAQKDNTHFFENEGAVLLTETHGSKIMEWANSGDGYVPINYKEEPTPVDANKELLTSTLDDIKTLCRTSVDGGFDKTILNAFIKKNNNNVLNFNNITDLDHASNLKKLIEDFVKESTGE